MNRRSFPFTSQDIVTNNCCPSHDIRIFIHKKFGQNEKKKIKDDEHDGTAAATRYSCNRTVMRTARAAPTVRWS